MTMDDVNPHDALFSNLEMDDNDVIGCCDTLVGSSDQVKENAEESIISASMPDKNDIVDDVLYAAARFAVNDVEDDHEVEHLREPSMGFGNVEGNEHEVEDEPQMEEGYEAEKAGNDDNTNEGLKNGEVNVETNLDEEVTETIAIGDTVEPVEEVDNIQNIRNEVYEEEYEIVEEIEEVSDEYNTKEVKNGEEIGNKAKTELSLEAHSGKKANKFREGDKRAIALVDTNEVVEETENIEGTRNEEIQVEREFVEEDRVDLVSDEEDRVDLLSYDDEEDVMNGEEMGKEAKTEENPEANSKKKVKRLRRRGKKRTLALRDADEVVKEVKDEEGKRNEANGEEKPTKNMGRLKRKRGKKKKKALRVPNEVVAKNTDNPEPSNRNIRMKAKGTGMIFMCSSKTKKDCYRYMVLGLPASKRDLVLEIHEGMKLFLFDTDSKLMYGIYKAAGPGGYNLEPKAFKSAFPSQVRFTTVEDCSPLAEKTFRKVIKDNYYSKSKFSGELTPEQVKNLCKLFRVSSKAPKPKPKPKPKLKPRNPRPEPPPRLVERAPKRPRRETRTFIDREPPPRLPRSPRAELQTYLARNSSTRRRTYEEERHPPSYSRNYVYPEDPVVYCREAYPPPRLLPSTYALPPLSEPDIYRRDQDRDRDPYRYCDQQLLEVEPRLRDEYDQRDSYLVYRERPLYARSHRDPMSSVGHSRAARAARAPEYYPPVSSRPAAEYRLSASRVSDYRPYRSVYRY